MDREFIKKRVKEIRFVMAMASIVAGVGFLSSPAMAEEIQSEDIQDTIEQLNNDQQKVDQANQEVKDIENKIGQTTTQVDALDDQTRDLTQTDIANMNESTIETMIDDVDSVDKNITQINKDIHNLPTVSSSVNTQDIQKQYDQMVKTYQEMQKQINISNSNLVDYNKGLFGFIEWVEKTYNDDRFGGSQALWNEKLVTTTYKDQYGFDRYNTASRKEIWNDLLAYVNKYNSVDKANINPTNSLSPFYLENAIISINDIKVINELRALEGVADLKTNLFALLFAGYNGIIQDIEGQYDKHIYTYFITAFRDGENAGVSGNFIKEEKTPYQIAYAKQHDYYSEKNKGSYTTGHYDALVSPNYKYVASSGIVAQRIDGKYIYKNTTVFTRKNLSKNEYTGDQIFEMFMKYYNAAVAKRDMATLKAKIDVWSNLIQTMNQKQNALQSSIQTYNQKKQTLSTDTLNTRLQTIEQRLESILYKDVVYQIPTIEWNGTVVENARVYKTFNHVRYNWNGNVQPISIQHYETSWERNKMESTASKTVYTLVAKRYVYQTVFINGEAITYDEFGYPRNSLLIKDDISTGRLIYTITAYKNGRVDTSINGGQKVNTLKLSGYFVFNKGQVVDALQNKYTGSYLEEGVMKQITDGKEDGLYTGIVNNVYYQDGTANQTSQVIDNAVVVKSNGYWVKHNGNSVTFYTGLVTDENVRKYINDGSVSSFSGLIQDGTTWKYFRNGVFDRTFTGVSQSNVSNKWYAVRNGILDWHFTGVLQNPNDKKWYFTYKGVHNPNYTGVATSVANGKWYHVRNGVLDWNFTGFSQSYVNKKWYFSRKGVLDWNFTGVAKSIANGKWYHAKNGQVDWNFTGLSKSVENGKWYFSRKGALDWNFTGVAKSIENGKWYYAKNGKLDWNYTGIAKSVADSKYYYVTKGKLNWNYSGKVRFGNSYKNVRKGKVV